MYRVKSTEQHWLLRINIHTSTQSKEAMLIWHTAMYFVKGINYSLIGVDFISHFIGVFTIISLLICNDHELTPPALQKDRFYGIVTVGCRISLNLYYCYLTLIEDPKGHDKAILKFTILNIICYQFLKFFFLMLTFRVIGWLFTSL